tara:strand:+ start:1774 stop:1929 length:156 start_codon:yes stop_codon:yes gene_type:complete
MTNQELAEIIEAKKADIIVFVGMDGNQCVTPDIEFVSMNGDAIQINLKEDA